VGGAEEGVAGSGDATNGPAAGEGAGGGNGAVEEGASREGTGGGFFARCLAQGRGATPAECGEDVPGSGGKPCLGFLPVISAVVLLTLALIASMLPGALAACVNVMKALRFA
jgi:hypothetical protein